jgi:hypothetical protein
MDNFAPIVDPFATARAVDAAQRMTGFVKFGNRNGDVIDIEQFLVWHLLVGDEFYLMLLQIRWRIVPCVFASALQRDNAAGMLRFGIYEGRRHFSVIQMLEYPPAKAGVRNGCHGICCAAIDLDKDDDTLGIGFARNAQFTQRSHRHADAKYLACTEMTVPFGGFS